MTKQVKKAIDQAADNVLVRRALFEDGLVQIELVDGWEFQWGDSIFCTEDSQEAIDALDYIESAPLSLED